MGHKKRVILIGENNIAPQALFAELVEKHVNSYLDWYANCENFLKQNIVKSTLANVTDGTLIILNTSNTTAAIRNNISKLKSFTNFKHIPILVLLNEEDTELIEYCYRSNAAGVVVVSDKNQAFISRLESTFNFWLEFVMLPKLVFIADTLVDKSNISEALSI